MLWRRAYFQRYERYDESIIMVRILQCELRAAKGEDNVGYFIIS